jgi:hypothetical protein
MSWWDEIAASETAKVMLAAQARITALQHTNVYNISPEDRLRLDLEIREANAEYWRARTSYERLIKRSSAR